MKKRLKVMVATPTMTNRVTIQIVGLLDALRTTSYESDAGFGVEYSMITGYSPVEYARNVCVGHFLRSECDKLWFIDEDMLPESSAVRLLHSDADIICARMYKFDHPNPEKGTTVGLGLCAMLECENKLYRPLMPSVGEASVQDVDAVGTGCTVIARHVLEDRRLWSPNVYAEVGQEPIDGNIDPGKGDWAPNVFRTNRAPNGKGLMGEDIDFSRRAKALGYSVKVDLNAVCGHWKSIDIDQAGFLAQETVKRVLNGVKLEDGKIMKIDPKALDYPSLDKAVHAGDFAAKAL